MLKNVQILSQMVQSAKATKSRIYGIIYRLFQIDTIVFIVVAFRVYMYLLIRHGNIYWHLVQVKPILWMYLATGWNGKIGLRLNNFVLLAI